MPQVKRQPITRETVAGTLTVEQVRSGISAKPKTRGTLRALGLRKIGDQNVLPDRPEIRGMLSRVSHLVTVTNHGEATAASGIAPSSIDKLDLVVDDVQGDDQHDDQLDDDRADRADRDERADRYERADRDEEEI